MTANPLSLGNSLLDSQDPRFAAACAAWNARIQHQPDAVVAASSADEIAAAVRYAADNSMRVRVMNTGHGANAACTDGLLLSTSGMRDVAIDPSTGVATIQAGAKWKDVVAAAYGDGFAAPCGTSSDVGSVGFTLGGGANWFVRKYGLASDLMRAAHIVTADGHARWVNAETEPDLFWALRGGGPNFGVVTAMQVQLAPHPEVYAGHLIWPVERVADVLTTWRDWVATMPPEITSTAAVLHTPDAPFVPEPMRGKSFAVVMVCYAGDDATGATLTEPLRRVDGLILDELGPMPFVRVDEVSQDPVDPLPHSLWSTMIGSLDDATIGNIVQMAPRDAQPYLLLEIRHVGGGRRPEPDLQGLAHWSGDFLMTTISVTPTSEAYVAAAAMGDRLDGVFASATTGMTPMNFVDSVEDVPLAFTPEHMALLLTVKAAYDPSNMFGGDRSIVTAG
jgi:FAD/FMN-containing dehydrogenase